MLDYISYLGVSTDKQGTTGLGMDAQREAVCRYVQNRGQIIAEFIEVEIGKCHTNRPQLLAALAECRKRRAVLLIARLDRLARNVAFIANLMDSDVEFLAVDTGAAPGRFPQSQTPSNRKPLRMVCRRLVQGLALGPKSRLPNAYLRSHIAEKRPYRKLDPRGPVRGGTFRKLHLPGTLSGTPSLCNSHER